MSKPTVAIVYDWLTTKYGGAENLLLALHQAFPEANLYTSVVNQEAKSWLGSWPVTPSFLQYLPFATTDHRWLAPLMPLAFESFDLKDADVVLSVTSNSAKGVLTSPDQLHISYLLTPPRFLYSHPTEYLDNNFLRKLAWPFLRYLKWWDQAAAARPDKIITLSHMVAERIAKNYQRAVDHVLYPPVDLSTRALVKPTNLPTPSNFFLVVSRLVKYKRIDLAIQACLQNKDHLIIIGDGPERANLEKIAAGSAKIHFLGQQPPSITQWYLTHCQALLMPGIEDFGITALDAVAHGRPAILHGQSGAAEVLSSKNAIFIHNLSLESMVLACQKIRQTTYNEKQLRQSIEKYATTTFVKNMQSLVLKYWSTHTRERTS